MYSSMSILIDYSILLFNKFVKFVSDSGLALKENYSSSQSTFSRNKAFVLKSHTTGEYIKAIKEFSPLKKEISFDEKKLILLLLGGSFYEESGVNIWHVCCFFHKIPSKTILSIPNMFNIRSKLLRNGILMIQEADFVGNNLSIQDIAEFYNNRKVFLSPFFIKSFFNGLTGEKNNFLIYSDSKRYNDLDTLINDISNLIKYVFFLSNYYRVNSVGYSYNKKKDPYQKGELSYYIKNLKKNIMRSNLKMELTEFLKNNNLSNIEFTILLYFIYKVTVRKETVINNIEEVLERFAIFPSQIKEVMDCFKKDGTFFKEGFLNIYEQDRYFEEEQFDFSSYEGETDDFDLINNDFAPIYISKEKIYSLIFDVRENKKSFAKDENESKIPDKREAHLSYESQSARGLFEIVIPRVKIDNVILDEKIKEELLGAVDLTRAAEVMKSWGVKPNLAASSFVSIKILL